VKEVVDKVLMVVHGINSLCHHVQDSVVMVKELFRNKEATEFVIATIPTMLAVNESARLLKSLRKENIPCKRIVVNQVCRVVVRLFMALVHMWCSQALKWSLK
jgi:anion-transporting  ArsA/GET3 family ATPase